MDVTSIGQRGAGLSEDQRHHLESLERSRDLGPYETGTLAALRMYGSPSEVARIDRLTGRLGSGQPKKTKQKPKVDDSGHCPTCGTQVEAGLLR